MLERRSSGECEASSNPRSVERFGTHCSSALVRFVAGSSAEQISCYMIMGLPPFARRSKSKPVAARSEFPRFPPQSKSPVTPSGNTTSATRRLPLCSRCTRISPFGCGTRAVTFGRLPKFRAVRTRPVFQPGKGDWRLFEVIRPAEAVNSKNIWADGSDGFSRETSLHSAESR